MEADLKLKLEQLHQRIDSLKDQINTEEGTKNAFVMPFIQISGYDIFNPTEVIPEFICDIGTKKGKKLITKSKKLMNQFSSLNANIGKKKQTHITRNCTDIFTFLKPDSEY